MDKLDLTKKAINLVVGVGVGKIVTGIIQNNTSPEKVTDHVSIAVGGFVLGSIAADASKHYTDAKIDEIAAWYVEKVAPKLKK